MSGWDVLRQALGQDAAARASFDAGARPRPGESSGVDRARRSSTSAAAGSDAARARVAAGGGGSTDATRASGCCWAGWRSAAATWRPRRPRSVEPSPRTPTRSTPTVCWQGFTSSSGDLVNARAGAQDALVARDAEGGEPRASMLGVIAQVQGRVAEAEAQLRSRPLPSIRALQSRPTTSPGCYAARGQTRTRPADWRRQALLQLPERAEVSDTLGDVYMRLGQPALALPLWRAAVERDPQPSYRYRLARAYRALGRRRRRHAGRSSRRWPRATHSPRRPNAERELAELRKVLLMPTVSSAARRTPPGPADESAACAASRAPWPCTTASRRPTSSRSRHGGGHPSPRSRRVRDLSRSLGRLRPCPPVDHRPRERPAAAGQRDRTAVDRLQRRDLQLRRAEGRARSARPSLPDPLRHGSDRPRLRGVGRRGLRAASTASGRWRCGRPTSASWSWRAIRMASARCTSASTAAGSISPAR